MKKTWPRHASMQATLAAGNSLTGRNDAIKIILSSRHRGFATCADHSFRIIHMKKPSQTYRLNIILVPLMERDIMRHHATDAVLHRTRRGASCIQNIPDLM